MGATLARGRIVDTQAQISTKTNGPRLIDLRSSILEHACVVIVDDEPANVRLLERILRRAGVLDVHGLTDPRMAVDRCLAVHPDIVLLDLNMPGSDGFEVMAALDAALPHDEFLPVVVLTADSTTATRDRALDAGAKDFLTKPFDHMEVLLRIRNLMETRSLYNDVQRHNAELQGELQRREEAERHAAEEHRARRERIERILSSDMLSMVYQPIADLHSGEVFGVEALARFDCEPKRPPNEWFDDAAAVGLGAELELAAVRAATAALDRLGPETFLSVNVSPQTAVHPDLGDLLDGLPVDRLVLELTEHARIEDYSLLVAQLDAARGRGLRIAVDDTGTGYAGLHHILSLRPDIIKLDLALTRGIDIDPARRALTIAMISFAREIRAHVIAEGIESHQELHTLRALNVPGGQGYLLARPSPDLPTEPRLAVLVPPA